MEIEFTKLSNDESLVDKALLSHIILVSYPKWNLLFYQARDKLWSAFYERGDGKFAVSMTPTHKELRQEFKKMD